MGSPLFTQTAVNAAVNIATANPNRDGTGTIGTLYTVPVGKQARIDTIQVKARVTTTAGMIRFFLHDGTNYRFWREVVVSAITVAASTPAYEFTMQGLGLLLTAGWSIRVSTEKAESFDISIINGGEFT